VDQFLRSIDSLEILRGFVDRLALLSLAYNHKFTFLSVGNFVAFLCL
jgi:hypothetical protein